MPVSLHVEKEGGAAVATCSGVLGLDDACNAAVDLWKTAGWSGEAALWDFRRSEFALSGADVQAVARFVLDRQPDEPPRRMAFVAQSDVDFGLARMSDVYREDPRTDFRIFRDYDEALEWVRGR